MTYDNTDSDADGTIDAPIDNESVSTDEINNTATVSQSANLQSALDNNDVVYIDSPINVSSEITVPNFTALVGSGFWRYPTATPYGGTVYGDQSSPIISTRYGAKLIGVGVANQGSGDAVRVRDAIPRFNLCDIYAASGTGIRCETDGSSLANVEPVINQCRITGDRQDGSINVRTVDMTDMAITGGTVLRYADKGVVLDSSTAFIGGETHIYCSAVNGSGPATSSIEVNTGSNTVRNAYLEGNVGDEHIHDTTCNKNIYTDNTFSGGNGVDGVHFDRPSGISNCLVTNNLFDGSGETTGQAVAQTDITGLFGSTKLQGNLVPGWDAGIKTADKGTYIDSGDGSTTLFTIPYDIFDGTGTAYVEPLSSAAADYAYLGFGSSNISVVYQTAPPSGTDNLEWAYKAVGGTVQG